MLLEGVDESRLSSSHRLFTCSLVVDLTIGSSSFKRSGGLVEVLLKTELVENYGSLSTSEL